MTEPLLSVADSAAEAVSLALAAAAAGADPRSGKEPR